MSIFGMGSFVVGQATLMTDDFVGRLVHSPPENQLLLVQTKQFRLQFLQPSELIGDCRIVAGDCFASRCVTAINPAKFVIQLRQVCVEGRFA